jgi:effector-binding domain-containing protein
MEYEIRFEQVNSCPTAVVRRQANLAELGKVIPAACGEVWNVVKSQKITGAGRHVAFYLDDIFNLEIGVELAAPFAGYGEVIGSTLPGGTVATTVHFGPYPLLHQAHQAIRKWCMENGHTLAGPNWDIYGHWLEEWNTDPSKIRTDVVYLLQPGRG